MQMDSGVDIQMMHFDELFEDCECSPEDSHDLLPLCSECEKPIEDEFCFVINGEPICEECMEQYKQPTAYLMG